MPPVAHHVAPIDLEERARRLDEAVPRAGERAVPLDESVLQACFEAFGPLSAAWSSTFPERPPLVHALLNRTTMVIHGPNVPGPERGDHVERWVQWGIDLNAPWSDPSRPEAPGITALQRAVSMGSLPLTQALLDAGAEADPLTSWNNHGEPTTPLASLTDWTPNARELRWALVRSGASLSAKEEPNGRQVWALWLQQAAAGKADAFTLLVRTLTLALDEKGPIWPQLTQDSGLAHALLEGLRDRARQDVGVAQTHAAVEARLQSYRLAQATPNVGALRAPHRL